VSSFLTAHEETQSTDPTSGTASSFLHPPMDS